MFAREECLYERFKCFKISNDFLCNKNLGAGRGGGAPMQFDVLEHLVSIYYRTALWMLCNLVGIKCSRPMQGVSAISVRGRSRVGQKYTSSSDWKATATNRLYNNDLEACRMKCRCIRFHSKVNFFICFWCIFGLSSGKGRGMHVCVLWEHIVIFYFWTSWWRFMKLGRHGSTRF